MSVSSDLFVFGPLCYLPLLECVVGGAVTVTPAVAPGFVTMLATTGTAAVLMAQPGGQASGVLLHAPSPQQHARLAYFVGATEGDLVSVSVQADGMASDALALMTAGAASDRPWDLDIWVRTQGALTLEAAPEILRAYDSGIPRAVLTARMDILRARAHSAVLTRAGRRPVTLGGRLRDVDIEVQDVSYPYEDFFRVEAYTLTHATHSGGRMGPIRRAVFNVCDAVTVLPYDPLRDCVLLVEQIRIGALARGDTQPWMLEPVAGMIDAGETPEQSARRETREEAHLDVSPDALHHVATYYPSPGGVAQRLMSYVAVVDLPGGTAGLGGEAAEHEDIRTHIVPFAHLMEMVASGEAANAPLIISAQWLALHRERLQGGARPSA
jgi:ADP-ribose pyrophosphatase